MAIVTVVGDNWYTVEQLDVIDQVYGEGFLTMNPHFPDEGEYIYEDGTVSYPHPIPLSERRNPNWESRFTDSAL